LIIYYSLLKKSKKEGAEAPSPAGR